MRILLKEEDKLFLIAAPEEDVRIGDVIQSHDILSQIIDVQFANLPGILEHILRQSLIPQANRTEEIQPEVKTVLETISDQKLLISKIRGHVTDEDGRKVLRPGFTEFNLSREKTEPKIIPPNELFEILDLTSNVDSITQTLGRTVLPFEIQPQLMGINLITGQKGSGKSYFSKRLLLRLVDSNVLNIVFDVNGEYQDLQFVDESRNNENGYAARLVILDPSIYNLDGRRMPFRIPLSEISADQFIELAYIGTDASKAAVHLFWNTHNDAPFGLNELETFVSQHNNEMVRNALVGRIQFVRALNLIGPLDITQIVQDLDHGGIVVINLFQLQSSRREMVVDIVLRWISRLSEQRTIESVSLYLEEAQSYVKTAEKFRDLLTRMRHIGVYPTFITNDPTTLPPEVFSLADNLISFRFKSDHILNHLARTGMIDFDSIKALRLLASRQCLTIGKFTKDFPLFLEVLPQRGVLMRGETRPLIPDS